MGNTKITKKDAVLAAGKELFWKHGFKRVSVEEVCEKAAVSKMTFYRFFANKTELAKAVFDKVMDDAAEQFRAIMYDESAAPEEKFQRMLLMKHEGSNDVSPEFLADFYTNKESEMQAYVELRLEAMWKNVVKDFEEAQTRGIFRQDFKPELILIVSRKITELLTDPAVLALYDKPQDFIMEVTRLMIYGITPHK